MWTPDVQDQTREGHCIIDIHHTSKPLISVILPVTHLHFCSFIVINTWAKFEYCGMGSTWALRFFLRLTSFSILSEWLTYISYILTQSGADFE